MSKNIAPSVPSFPHARGDNSGCAQERASWRQRAVQFLQEIGLTVVVHEGPCDTNTFLPGIRVTQGGLEVFEDAFPGDVLHEGAHLALMPSQFRPLANGGLSAAFKAMNEYVSQNPWGLATFPEDPICRAVMQCSDPEATAWQYAAARHIGLPDEWLFTTDAYDGNAESVLTMLRAKRYMGINGLQTAGWTLLAPNPYRPGVPQYPEMAHWLCTATAPAVNDAGAATAA